MSGFCPNCNSPLEEGVNFCGKCGTAINNQSAAVPYAAMAGGPSVGFSDRVNNPEILAAVKKNRTMGKVFALIIVPLPLIGFLIYSFVSDKMETAQALKYGAIVSAIFLLFAVYSLIRNRASNAYEAVVTDKKTKERTERTNDDDIRTYTEFIIVAETTDGKKKKIRETDRGRVLAYNYLDIGDRFRYHPQFAFPYELYDKSKFPYVYCVSCGRQNPIDADRCGKCNVPLLK